MFTNEYYLFFLIPNCYKIIVRIYKNICLCLVIIWHLKFPSCLNGFIQKVHLNFGFTPHSYLRCVYSAFFDLYTFLQLVLGHEKHDTSEKYNNNK